MAKLSDSQSRALTELIETGVTSAKANTLKSLEGKYIDTGNTDYKISVRMEAYDALGIERPSATTDEIIELLGSNPWDNISGQEKPFVVQELIGNIWTRVGRAAATWGTANVWRNRMAAKGLTVRVHNIITDQVWA